MNTLADDWDQVYLPGSSAASPHQVFTSRAAATAAGLANLRYIHTGSNCATSWMGDGSLSCTLLGNPATYSEVWSSTNPAALPKLRGFAFPSAGGKLGGNGHSNLEPPTLGWPVSLADGQVDQIRKTLRYDQKIQAGAEPRLAALGNGGGGPSSGGCSESSRSRSST
ncbi:MAG: hypothetical protein IT374_04935 [Polyangiaceae bacterium]|nr:hypothetical protein [Polyangiaceae bacterium]